MPRIRRNGALSFSHPMQLYQRAESTMGSITVANNLHVSYDLIKPDKNYEKVIAKIKELGSWAKIHYSYWYVDSTKTASQAVDFLKPALDSNDKVYVVDATNNNAAWNSLPDNVAQHIRDHWHK